MKKDTSQPEAAQKQRGNCAVLFDMDGVLVDVSGSYRRAIQETVGFFTAKKAQLKEIQEFKEQGGYNNDWDLTEAILAKRGKSVPKTEIKRKFQELYLGAQGKKGFIENEKWLLPTKQLEQLHEKHCLGIVTGRPREETLFVLRKFKVKNLFDVIVAMEDYPAEKSKPDPYPISLALSKLGAVAAIFVGDSVDDIAAAKRAGIMAVGCIPPGIFKSRLEEALLKSGADKILNRIDKINEILQ